MKKVAFLFCLFGLLTPSFAETNIMFGKKINSLTLYAAQSTGSGTLFKLIDPILWQFHPQTFLMLQYSQPTTFFRLDSRLNLNITQNIAYNSSHGLSFSSIGISIDTVIFQYKNWYTGIGIGPYMRDNLDRWVDSRLVFGEKFFIGKSISENWNFEIFTIHFSNGHLTKTNKGFNFTGFSIGYKF